VQGDPEVVAALVAGDPRGLEAAYRAYADRLYAFCRGLLQRPGEAADAVHDTFVVASQWAARLRDPEMLRCWLYALARAECLRVLRGRARRLPAVEPDHVTGPDPRTGLGAAQVQELVWSAAEGMDLADWDIFELAVRHELTPAEVAEVLEIAREDAQARLAQVRTELALAVGALLVARTGRQACPALAALLRGWDGWRLATRTRGRVGRHVESCQTCQRHVRERQLLSATSVLAAYATAPFPAVPAELWPRLRATGLAPSFAPSRAAILARAVPLDPDNGFPHLPDGRRPVPRAAALAATALVTMLAAGASTFLTPDLPATAPPPADQAAPPGSAVAPDSPSLPPSPDPVGSVPASAGVPAGQVEPTSPPLAPAPGSGPDAEPSSSPPGPPGTLTVEATAEPVCAADGSYRLSATVTASRPLAAAVLSVKAQGNTTSYPMTVNGSTASVLTDPMTANLLRWQVDVTDRGQDTAATPEVKINRVCKD
jgi:RNA polymerase sigma factor (sigma-70 family)